MSSLQTLLIKSTTDRENLNNTKDYDDLTDRELIEKVRKYDDKAEKYLYVRYTFIVKRIVSSFFLIGGDKDDLYQEAMIGFMSAVKNYDLNGDNSFRFFAELCIRRQIISAIRKVKGKDIRCISLYENLESEECIVDTLVSSESMDPESIFIIKEQINEYYEAASVILSTFERNVLVEYGKGKSYEEISLVFSKDVKSIDNAIQRIKKKIRKNKEKLFKK